MSGICLLCHRSTRRKATPRRPLCCKCEKTAPVAMSAPGLFTRGPAATFARAVESAVAQLENQRSAKG